ncbi:MAG: AAA family ATPase [Campylobacterales bacterium]
MELKIEKLFNISSAHIKLDGLTVVAGENDTGKSSIGKALYSVIKADNTARAKNKIDSPDAFFEYRAKRFEALFRLVFGCDYPENSKIKLTLLDRTIYDVSTHHTTGLEFEGLDQPDPRPFMDATFIETPLIWSLADFFNTIILLHAQEQSEDPNIDPIKFPHTLRDLHNKLYIEKDFERVAPNLTSTIRNIIGGDFKVENKKFSFYKNNVTVPLENTATGIKNFAILQVLNENSYINPRSLLIFDEPEVHLHPKWEIEMAKIIIDIVKAGVKVVVNSHSPYMIEALILYSRKNGLGGKSNYYLAQKDNEDGKSFIHDVTTDLDLIFKKLADPFRELEELRFELS